MSHTPPPDELKVLRAELDDLRVAFVTALIWMGSSANSPLGGEEIQRLIKLAQEHRND